jgi:uncharacterized damage-inducible protein DinB
MIFSVEKSFEILERTPEVLQILLQNLSEEWTHQNEGNDTWSAYDVIGHLIHGELTDWIPRAEIILSNSDNKQFPPFDRFAQFDSSKGKSLHELLSEFSNLRKANLERLRSINITEDKLRMTGIHPAFGEVTLSELLATWVVHDLNHLAQISRVMAKQYKQSVGPWVQYLGVLNK